MSPGPYGQQRGGSATERRDRQNGPDPVESVVAFERVHIFPPLSLKAFSSSSFLPILPNSCNWLLYLLKRTGFNFGSGEVTEFDKLRLERALRCCDATGWVSSTAVKMSHQSRKCQWRCRRVTGAVELGSLRPHFPHGFRSLPQPGITISITSQVLKAFVAHGKNIYIDVLILV